MSVSVFSNKEIEPDDSLLESELGSSKDFLNEIIRHIQKVYGEARPEWKHYGAKTGWLLKVFYKKRNLFFVVPFKGFFKVSFVFGDKAVENVMSSALPDKIKQELMSARKYAEGRGLQVEVKIKQDVECVLELVRIKMNN